MPNPTPSAAVPATATPKQRLRILLLSPRGPLYRHRGGIWKKTMRYAPLTLTTLASLIPPELNADVQVIDEGIDQIEPDKLQADLVGISAITGTSLRAYEIAAQFRRRDVPVVLGGVHPTLLPEEAQQHADAICVVDAGSRVTYANPAARTTLGIAERQQWRRRTAGVGDSQRAWYRWRSAGRNAADHGRPSYAR